uniref:beta-mannosidase n=1 Tax=Meloidogyne hapla TaxID=6305 RepID=A0A1I8AXH5_MELHA
MFCKIIFYWLLFLLINFIYSLPSKIDLGGNFWNFYSPKLNISGSAIVPGDIYADLEANDFIKNPLFGQGDKIFKWIGQQDWTYERTIILPQQVYNSNIVLLKIHGLNGFSSIYFNDYHITNLDNQFLSYSIDLTSLLIKGMNFLRISFKSNVKEAERRSDVYKFLHNHALPPECPPTTYNGECHVNFLRSMQAGFAWDWGPSMPFDKLLDSTQKRIAFRSIYLNQSFVNKLDREKGRFFQFEVNNISIFLKGTNFVPISIFPSRNNTLRRNFLFHSMIKANMNVLRVWGGGYYEFDDFYNLADELGLLIWHDFMFACALYPTNKAFLNSVKKEVKEQVLRLRHHPSLLCWAGNNENELAIRDGWYFAKNYSKELQSKDYLILYKQTIQPIVEKFDTSRPFLLSSPSNGIETEIEGGISQNPGSPLYGDIHFYIETKNLWEDSTYLIPRCATEFGVQSMPFKSTMINWIKEEDWKYTSETLLERQHHPGGALTLPMMILQHFLMPSNSSTSFIDKFAFLSQIHQAIALQTQIEHYRRWRSNLNLTNGLGNTMCAMYWQLNDVWAAPTWSTIDFNLRWKIGHYFVKRSFAPLILSMVFF